MMVVVEFRSPVAPNSYFITDCGLFDLLLKLCFSYLITFSLLLASFSITKISSDTKKVLVLSVTLVPLIGFTVEGVLIEPVLAGGFLITGGF